MTVLVDIDAKSKFLIASSNSENHILIQRVLKTSGFTLVEEASNGIEALDLCIKGDFDFIIADVELKYLSGLNFIKECKNHEKIKNIPIVLIGVEEMSAAWKVDFEEYGVPGYLVHPFDPKVLLTYLAGVSELLKNPSSLESLYSKAKVALIEEDTEVAIDSYSVLQDKTNKSTRSTLGLVHAFSQKNDTDAMEQALGEVKDPDNKQALLLRYKTAILADRIYDAQDALNEILKGEDDNPFYYLRTLGVALLGRSVEHVKYIADEGIKKDFPSPDFLIGRAKASYMIGDTKSALTDLARAEKKYGISLSLLNLRAICYRKESKYDQALICYDQALQIEPMNHYIYFNLGICLHATGQIQQAKDKLAICLKYNPKFTKAQEKLAELNMKESA